jgi:hypothetical protein
MLIIRAEQLRILEDDAVCRWIAGYLQASYPEHARAYGRSKFERLVADGFRKARARQIAGAQEVRKFVHVAFVLGPGFPDDPEFAPLKRILDDPKYHNTTVRLRALEDAALEYVTRL